MELRHQLLSNSFATILREVRDDLSRSIPNLYGVSEVSDKTITTAYTLNGLHSLLIKNYCTECEEDVIRNITIRNKQFVSVEESIYGDGGWEHNDVNLDVNTLFLSYIPKGSPTVITDKYSWSRSGRQVAKAGKLLQKVCKEQSIPMNSEQMAEIIARIKSKNIANTFKVVSGVDISNYYDGNCYAERQGSLSGSCMKDSDYDLSMSEDIATGMVCLFNDDEELLGRALLWLAYIPDYDDISTDCAIALSRTIDSIVFCNKYNLEHDVEYELEHKGHFIVMDRVYGTESTMAQFEKFALDNKIICKREQNYSTTMAFNVLGQYCRIPMRLSKDVDIDDYTFKPYYDTFKFYNSTRMELSNDAHLGYDDKLNDTTGGTENRAGEYDDESECYGCGEMATPDNMFYINDELFCSDCATWSTLHDKAVLRENLSWSEYYQADIDIEDEHVVLAEDDDEYYLVEDIAQDTLNDVYVSPDCEMVSVFFNGDLYWGQDTDELVVCETSIGEHFALAEETEYIDSIGTPVHQSILRWKDEMGNPECTDYSREILTRIINEENKNENI